MFPGHNNSYNTSPTEQEYHNSKNTGTSNPKRTRITRACDTCRRKKIKCDVDSQHPCTTCRQYDWECTFHDTAKKRGPPKGYIESLETRLEKMEQLLKSIGDDQGEEALPESSKSKRRKQLHTEHESEAQHQSTSSLESSRPPATELTSQNSKSKVVRYHGSSSGYYLVGNILSKDEQSGDNVDLHLNSAEEDESHEQQKMFVVPSHNGRDTYRLRRMNANDNDLMVVRDATADEEACQLAVDEQDSIDDIVPRSVLTALVHTYFKDAHTTLPVLEKDEFMDAFEGRTSPHPAPLLTYAICTYSCFLLGSNDPIFKEQGVERDDVFQTLLDKASMLVRREYLKPRIVTIQALVLLCGHPTYSTSSYRNWILAGMAVRMAQDLGLHRTITTVEVSSEFKERRKRLWYSTYITDRWCCAVMGRPLAIADSDCDVDLPLVSGPDQNEDLTVFVNFVKLSGILGEVLRRIYSPKAKLHGYKTAAMEQTVWSLHKMLEEWFTSVPDGYKITAQDLVMMNAEPQLYAETKKVTEGGPMTVCFHAVVLLLHRPFIVLEKAENDMPSLSRSSELCTQAAKSAIDVARAIPYMSIAKFGWNFAAYSVFQAALIHIYNCTSKDPAIVKQAREYVNICTYECLTPLSKDIPAGPPLIPFLQTLATLLENDNGNEGDTQPQSPPQSHPQEYPQTTTTTTTENNGINLQQELPGSWLLNGGMGGGPALSQAAWQQLFSTAGTPFSTNETINRGFEAQGWDNFFMDNQASNNTFLP